MMQRIASFSLNILYHNLHNDDVVDDDDDDGGGTAVRSSRWARLQWVLCDHC